MPLHEFIPTEHFLQAAENERTCLLQKLQLLGILDGRELDSQQRRRMFVVHHEVRIRLTTTLEDQLENDLDDRCNER